MLSKYYNGTTGMSGLNRAEIDSAGEYAFGGENQWNIVGFHRPVEGLTAGQLQDTGLKFFLRRLVDEAARLGVTDLPDNHAQDAIAHRIGELMMPELQAGGA